MKVTGLTKLGMVIGSPIKGSLSPIIHNAAIESLGLDAIFVPYELREDHFNQFLSSVCDVNLFGISVTMPLKTVAAQSLNLTDTAKQLNAVNTICSSEGELIGDNTDGKGFIESLIFKFDIKLKDKSVFIYGAGGAARAIVYSLVKEGCRSIHICNRSEDKVADLITLSENVAVAAQLNDASSCDIVVNCTSVGMKNTSAQDIDPFKDVDFRDHQIVYDIVTSPTETALLKHAISQGAQIAEGYNMLVFQGVLAFTKFSGIEAPVSVMLQAVADWLESQV